jgi:cbb3-type cytochrome oxidase maturation protein
MSALFVLIGVSLFVAVGFLIAFIWSVKSGQYEDDYTPSIRILFDDKPKKQEETEPKESPDKETKK